MIRLIVDSTFDFEPEFVKDHAMEIVPLSVIFGSESYKENVELSKEAFYEKMASSTELPKTSQPSPQSFLKVFEKAVETKDQLIVMTLSSGLSGTYQSACLAANLCSGVDIEIIDTKNVSLGAQIQALEVLKMIEQGMEYHEIVKRARENVSKARMIAMINTLENLIKGGRLSKVEGMVGSLIAIKPLITIDEEGKIATLSKSRGLRKGIADMISNLKSQDFDESKTMVCGYTSITSTLDQFLDAFDDERYAFVQTTSIGAVVGTHAGATAAAAAYFVK